MYTIEDFNKLSDEEKTAVLKAMESDAKKIKDQEAEISSLKKELEENRITIEEGKKDLAATKELNYTLARKVNTEKDRMSFEDALLGAFGKGGKNDN
jgi:TRAP-type C4-dicarboxylate transport system substrate-binding protein